MRDTLATFCLICLLLGHSQSGAAEEPQTNSRVEQLVQLCKLWGTIKFSHPYLATRDIDWNGALVKALRTLGDSSDMTSSRRLPPSSLDTD